MKKNIFGIVVRIVAFVLGFYVFAQDEDIIEEDADQTNHIEQIASKVEQTVAVFNQASIEQQRPGLDLLFDAAYFHENIHVSATAWSTLEALEVKYESENFSGSRFINTIALASFPPPSNELIEFSVESPQKPISGNVSDIYVFEDIKNLQSIGGEISFDGYNNMLLVSYASKTNTFELLGKARDDIAKIEVVRDGDQKRKELSDFEPGQQDFSYQVSPKDKNIQLGANKYLIRGYTKDAVYHTIVTVVHLNDKSGSLAGEEIVSEASPVDERRQKMSSCYADFENEDEQQLCINQVTQDYTINEQRACAMDDGRLNYFFQIQRPNKAAVIEHLYKNGTRLYYPVKLGNQYPGCEDEGYEILLYYYDCASGERVKVLGNNSDEDKFLKCDLQIQYADDDVVVARKAPYERSFGTYEGYELISLNPQGVDKLTLFDAIEIIGTGGETNEITGFDGNQKLLQKIDEIVSVYNLEDLVFDGINYEIRDIQDDLTATLRIFVYGRAGTSIIYDAKVDLLNKQITLLD